MNSEQEISSKVTDDEEDENDYKIYDNPEILSSGFRCDDFEDEESQEIFKELKRNLSDNPESKAETDYLLDKDGNINEARRSIRDAKIAQDLIVNFIRTTSEICKNKIEEASKKNEEEKHRTNNQLPPQENASTQANTEKKETFDYNKTINKLESQAIDKMKSMSNSFWGYLCNVTTENQIQIEKEYGKQQKEDSNGKLADKPMFGFTFGKW